MTYSVHDYAHDNEKVQRVLKTSSNNALSGTSMEIGSYQFYCIGIQKKTSIIEKSSQMCAVDTRTIFYSNTATTSNVIRECFETPELWTSMPLLHKSYTREQVKMIAIKTMDGGIFCYIHSES